MDSTERTTDYETFFDPVLYLQNNYDQPQKDAFVLRKLSDFFRQIDNDNLNNMLEFGAGPVISRLITATKYVKNIITSDYLSTNRQEIEKWVNEDEKAFNWKPTFEYVIQHLEGLPLDTVKKRQAEVREKIKAVVPCDLKANIPLVLPRDVSTSYGPPFDVILMCFCIEAVVDNDKKYKEKIAYLSSLLRRGGYLVMFGVTKEEFYSVGDTKFCSFPLSKKLIVESMEETGLKNIQFDLYSNNASNEEFAAVNPVEDLKSGLKDYYSVYGQI